MQPHYVFISGWFAYSFLIRANPGLFCLFFTVKLFTKMIYKLGIQYRHFCISYKLCLLSRLISAHGREYWEDVKVASWLYKTERFL